MCNVLFLLTFVWDILFDDINDNSELLDMDELHDLIVLFEKETFKCNEHYWFKVF